MQELLFLASLEFSTFPSESLKPVALEILCEEILRDNAAELEGCSCKVVSSFTSITVEAAAEALRRAIENVFRNAMRYCPKGSEIGFRCGLGQDSGTAVIEVSDRGEGVPASMLTAIFQPFVRGVPSLAGKEGTGLGLAIAAEAAALHRGTISAENRSECGFSVVIRLPTASLSVGNDPSSPLKSKGTTKRRT